MELVFTHPAALFLLIVPFLLLVWVWRRAAGRVALPFDHAVEKRGPMWWMTLSVLESAPAMILAIAIIILSGPQQLSEPKTQKTLTNIEFCVDVSGSMTATFGSGSRYDAAMKAINEFIDYREGDAFGLTIFGHNVLHWVPLTSDVSAFRCAPPFLRPENLPSWFNGTMIGKGLNACLDVLSSREEGDRMIILITDGYSSDLSNGKDEEIAARLRKQNVVVYAVHVANGALPAQLVTITSRTGGEVFQPGDVDALKTVFRRIDSMQETKLEKSHVESMDNFVPYCIASLSVLCLALLALFGLRYTPW
jgi:Ca-activated chloride channel family protein